MKKIPFEALMLALFCVFNPAFSTARAQGTAFTYQGRLNDGANVANGTYDLRFANYDAQTVGTQQGNLLTNSATAVSNGLFTVTLDFGNQFPGAARWLDIGVRTNGATSFFTLSPRQPLTPAPYAITAGNVIAGGLTTGTYGSAVTFNNVNNSFSGSFSGNGANVTNVNAVALGGLSSSNFWKTAGNSGTAAGANFVGTTDNQPLNLRVNNTRAFHLEPTANDASHSNIVNVLGGSPANVISSGIYGATIAGGGAAYYFGFAPTNAVTADFGTVSGGFGNTSSGNNGTVGGGYGNTSSALEATIGGGYFNVSSSNSTTVAGGAFNTASGNFATVGGGQNNTAGGDNSVVAGGYANTVNGLFSGAGSGWGNFVESGSAFIGAGIFSHIQTNANASFIGGGANNVIQSGAGFSFIGGGLHNTNSALEATIGGGDGNTSSGLEATIGGGHVNTSSGGAATVGGGYFNVSSSNSTTVAGGAFNTASGQYATVGGGYANTSSGDNSGVGSGYGNTSSALDATIGGGYGNISSGGAATIGGGFLNVSSNNSSTVAGGAYNVASGQESAVGGGQNNTVTGPWSTVAGGAFNSVTSAESSIGGGQINTNSADYSVIGGGKANLIQTSDPGSFGSFIGGGQNNTIQTNASGSFIGSGNFNLVQSNAQYSVIVGGRQNTVQNDSAYSVIGGGYFNGIQTNTAFSVIGGGSINTVQSNALGVVIGGGDGNTAGGIGGTVPGGIGNSALGNVSFAAGTHAQATNDGAFVLSDAVVTNFYSTTSNQFSARFGGGVRFVTGGAGMTLDGQPVLAGNNVNATTLGGLASSNFWKTTGNAGTTPGVNFIGTTDGQPLLLHAGFVGVGRSSPVSGAEYFGVEAPVTAGNYGGMYVDTANSGSKPFYGYSQAGVAYAWTYVDGSDGNKWKLSYGLTVTPSGNVGIGTTTPGSLLVVGSSGSPAYCNGTTWQNGSDRNSKEQFTTVNPGELLERVSALPITEWRYKVEADGTRHLGPMAQDFHAAFGLNGSDDTHIATVDEGGVALAAIQGLNQKLEAKSQKAEVNIQELKAENAGLKQRLAALEQIIFKKKPN